MTERLLTPAEYLVIERAAVERSEFDRGRMIPVPRSSYAHSAICDNLSVALADPVGRRTYTVLSRQMRVRVAATGLYTYPDVLILVGRPELEEPQDDVLLNPRVVIEVHSPATERYDRGAKFRHYQQILSFQEYVLIARDEVLIERFVRQPDESWTLTMFADPAGTFALASVPTAAVRLADVYRDVQLPPHPPR